MATLFLQIAGAALGNSIGGAMLGAVGQAVGGIAGSMIDQSLLGGGGGRRIVEGPRLKEISGLASSEGAPIPRLYGRSRLGGQLIWATRFEEVITTTITRTKPRGKSFQKAQKTYETTYSYYANLAVGLCEGPIAFVRRVWADGRELDLNSVTMRLHHGYESQQPDPLILAKEGVAPAYRGLAYVVFERLPLAEYGNRVPQFSFEVVRRVEGLSGMIRAATLIPGASEFIYHSLPVSHEPEPGVTQSETRHQLQSASDVDAAIGHLLALCPSLRRISLVVSWFGDDLRAGSCTVAPRVEIAHKPTFGAEWSVAGLTRAASRVVSLSGGTPAYGGTPSDDSVVALIRRLRGVYGLEVVLYPFIMMDVPSGNALPDPQSGSAGQPPYPWRGRITCAPAPGRPGSVDGTAAAAAQVAAFLGSARPADFSLQGEKVLCARPDEWSFRRLILHYATLAAAAGGVEGFVIGSELVGLTRVRGAAGYPMVDGLVSLANDVRSILPAWTKLTYAADWTEYGAHVREGGQEVRFPLDPLWAAPAIDAIGIDYYAPLTDWRDSSDHLDLALAQGPADLAYLRSRLNSGEGYDWFYADASGRALQQRLPISDGAYQKPWIYRPKDLPNWWGQRHIERSGGIETVATPWIPGSKPIWLTEIGVPAVDKGGNAPNVFPDAKSVDGGVPHFSSGARDDLVQARGLEAIISGFDPAQPGFVPALNPLHPQSGLRMVDPANIFIWTWDARPFPAFPDQHKIWADGPNWETGHWLNGRLEGTPLDRLIRALLADFGLPAPDELVVDGFVDGYVLDRPLSARQALEPLAEAFGFDATMASGRLVLRGRGGRIARALGPDDLLLGRDGEPYELRRAEESELPRELRLSFSDGDSDYRRVTMRSRRLAGAARRESGVETAIVTRPAEGQRLADQRLQEIWAGRETIELDLSPRCLDLEPGDVVSLPVDGAQRLFRLTRLSDGPSRKASGRAVEPAVYAAVGARGPGRPAQPAPALPGRPHVIPFDLPLVRAEPPPLLHLAAFAAPWPGGLAIWRAPAEGGAFALHSWIEAPSTVGETLTQLPPGPLWRSDRGAALDVRLRGGSLSSVSREDALAGANALALLDASGEVEIVTAARAELIGPQRFRLSGLLRGLGGSEQAASRSLPAGSRVVVLDGAAAALVSELSELGRPFRYRIGPPQADPASPAMAELLASGGGAALKPLSPVRVRARRLSGTITFSWLRRSRIDGDSWELAEIPLGEEGERYRIAIYGPAGLLRSLIVTAPGWTYPSAQEIEDFGALQTEIEIAVAQISAVVGEGREWRGRLTLR